MPRSVPPSSKPFRDKYVADRAALASDGAELASIPVFVAPVGDEREAAGIEQGVQPALCSLAELLLARAARRAEFRRVDIGDPDLFALMPEGVAVNDAIGLSSGIADRE